MARHFQISNTNRAFSPSYIYNPPACFHLIVPFIQKCASPGFGFRMSV
ncbi:MAG: hypothetical protein OJF51_002871 [Nitrospira sp.]|nr:MAG: hypothetical protein OJF51_002871 [Nitrospira sp.]